MPASPTAPASDSVRTAAPAFKGPLKIAIYVTESALAPIEQARQMLLEELGLGEAPPLDLMLEIALLRVDPDELATSVQSALLQKMGKQTRELPLEEPTQSRELSSRTPREG